MQVALSLVESSCVPVANDEGTALGSYTLSLYVRSHGGVGALRFNPTRRDNSPTSFPLLPAPSSGSYTLNLCVPYQAAVGSHRPEHTCMLALGPIELRKTVTTVTRASHASSHCDDSDEYCIVQAPYNLTVAMTTLW